MLVFVVVIVFSKGFTVFSKGFLGLRTLVDLLHMWVKTYWVPFGKITTF